MGSGPGVQATVETSHREANGIDLGSQVPVCGLALAPRMDLSGLADGCET